MRYSNAYWTRTIEALAAMLVPLPNAFATRRANSMFLAAIRGDAALPDLNSVLHMCFISVFLGGSFIKKFWELKTDSLGSCFSSWILSFELKNFSQKTAHITKAQSNSLCRYEKARLNHRWSSFLWCIHWRVRGDLWTGRGRLISSASREARLGQGLSSTTHPGALWASPPRAPHRLASSGQSGAPGTPAKWSYRRATNGGDHLLTEQLLSKPKLCKQ